MQSNDLLTFKRRSNPLLTPTAIFVMFIILAFFSIKIGGGRGIGYAVLSIIVTCIIPSLAPKSLASIIIDEENHTITLILNQWGWIYKKVLFPIAEIRITFKTEMKMGSINRRVFRLFHGKKQVIATDSGTEGWEPEVLEEIQAIVDKLKNNPKAK